MRLTQALIYTFMYSYILSIVLMIQNKLRLFQNSRPDHHILLNKLMLSIHVSETIENS